MNRDRQARQNVKARKRKARLAHARMYRLWKDNSYTPIRSHRPTYMVSHRPMDLSDDQLERFFGKQQTMLNMLKEQTIIDVILGVKP